MSLARLFVILALDSGPFKAGMMQAITQVQMLNRQMGGMSGATLSSVGRSLTMGLTVPIIAAAAAIGFFGSKLDSELARVQSVIASPTDSGLSTVMAWRDEIQDLAITLGRSSPEIAGGMYEIVSAMGNIPNAMDFLSVSAKAAVAGQSDVVTSTKNLVLAMRAWYEDSTKITKDTTQNMADLMSATVRVGTVTESELGPAMANLLPIGRLYNVQLNELFAGIASLAGVSGSATQASTQLQRAIISITSPNTALAKAYKKLGIASGEALIEQRGLLGAFQAIMTISEKTGVPLNKLLGRVEAVKAVATLTGPQLQNFGTNLDAISNAAGAVDLAFAGTTQGINKAAFQWAQAMQRLRVIAEDLYQSFAPASLKVLDALSPIIDHLRRLADVIASMSTENVTRLLYVLLGLAALGPTLSILGSIVTLFRTFGSVAGLAAAGVSSLLGPLGLVILAVIALWFAWQNNWGNIQGRTASAVSAIKGHLIPLGASLNSIVTAAKKLWTAFSAADLSGTIEALEQLKAGFRSLGGDLVMAAVESVGAFFNIDTSGIQNAIRYLGDLYNAIANVGSAWEGMGMVAGAIGKGAQAGIGAASSGWNRLVTANPGTDMGAGGMFGQYMKDTWNNLPSFMDVTNAITAGNQRWIANVQNEFAKGYTQAISGAVNSTNLAPVIGPPTFAQVQRGLQTVQIGPAVAPVMSTGFTTGVNTANWGAVTSALSAKMVSTTQQPVDAMVTAMQTQLGQALASDTVAGIVGPALETAVTTAVSQTNFDAVGTKFVTAMQQTMTQVRTAITSANLSSTMSSQVSLMVLAFTVRMATMTAAARTAVASVRQAFMGQGWSSVGMSISSGIAAGISAGSGAIRAAAASAASSAYSAAMAALKANSPSRLMMAPGLYASQGLAIGILRGIGYIQSAANRMIEPLANVQIGGYGGGFAFAGAGGGMTITIENTFNGPVDQATVEQVKEANTTSITQALQRRGLF